MNTLGIVMPLFKEDFEVFEALGELQSIVNKKVICYLKSAGNFAVICELCNEGNYYWLL